MDIKDVLMHTEDSLPTLEQNLSTTTVVPANGGLPGITASPMGYFKFGASTVMGLLGMVFLAQGKKHGDVGKMLTGAALTLGSLFIF